MVLTPQREGIKVGGCTSQKQDAHSCQAEENAQNISDTKEGVEEITAMTIKESISLFARLQ